MKNFQTGNPLISGFCVAHTLIIGGTLIKFLFLFTYLVSLSFKRNIYEWETSGKQAGR